MIPPIGLTFIYARLKEKEVRSELAEMTAVRVKSTEQHA
jgi:hypothetical protein